MSNKLLPGIVLVVCAIAVAIALLVSNHSSGAPAGSTLTSGVVENNQYIFTGGLAVGSNGDGIKGINFGTCYVWAGANTIAASSSATVECTGSSSGNDATALTGVSNGDVVNVTLATSSVSVGSGKGGLIIMSETASSTAGFITMQVYNLSGTTFTWSAAASTTKFTAMR